MKTAQERLEDLYQVFDFTTVEELDNYIKEADEVQICNLINEIGYGIHCNMVKFMDREFEHEYIYDMEIRCFLGEDKKYEVIIEDQYVGYENGIEELISDIIAYEKEAEWISFIL